MILIATSILLSSSRVESRTVKRASVQAGARQTISLMTTEMRQAGADPSIPPVGIVAIVGADSQTLHVRADLNGDGVIQTAEPSEDVTYAYDSTARVITRNPGSGASPLLTHVTAMGFTYFDSANQPLAALPLSAADAALVHAIALTITCEDRDSQPITLTTRVTLRNM